MHLTKFSHSCVRIEDGGRSLIIDPGVFSEVEQALDGVEHVLITHEHADHVEPDRLRAAAGRNSRLRSSPRRASPRPWPIWASRSWRWRRGSPSTPADSRCAPSAGSTR